MGTVAGLPMASTGPDRDGLTLDRVHVPLGPLLPEWPAGLVVHVTLQGDVVQEAAAEILDGPASDVSAWTGRPLARELDALARLLGVAGWDDAADRARRLRDELMAGEPDGGHVERVLALGRRVRRSRMLRWLVRGIPAGRTNVLTLIERRLTATERAAREPDDASRPGRIDLAGLAEALVGAELAAVRLIVAAVDPDPDVPASRAVDPLEANRA